MHKREQVFLVNILRKAENKEKAEELTQEFQQLANSANLYVAGTFQQFIEKPNNATFMGSGKIREIASKAKSKKIKTLVFNENLSPAQARNISNISHCNVVDRTELILDIFSERARTKQAKLQVELAQLEYSFTKLKHLWKHLSRIQGGIGFRGPGETQIETDRREIRKRITILKNRIANIHSTTQQKRKHRKNMISVSLVGYTNAGKTTLLNQLTTESLYTANQLFATLDSTTRSLHLTSGEKLVLTDTIGFIRNLPHFLITSFHSTLLEVEKADLLLHVVDISQPNPEEAMQAVDNVLQELKVERKNILMVFNKCDKLDRIQLAFVKKKWLRLFPHAVFLSAKKRKGIDSLLERLSEFITKSKIEAELFIPDDMQNLVSFLHEKADIIEETYDWEKKENVMRLQISRKLYPAVLKQIENFRLLEYIHK